MGGLESAFLHNFKLVRHKSNHSATILSNFNRSLVRVRVCFPEMLPPMPQRASGVPLVAATSIVVNAVVKLNSVIMGSNLIVFSNLFYKKITLRVLKIGRAHV